MAVAAPGLDRGLVFEGKHKNDRKAVAENSRHALSCMSANKATEEKPLKEGSTVFNIEDMIKPTVHEDFDFLQVKTTEAQPEKEVALDIKH